jgi:3-oxoacyl-[acyl-carrier protein] reductase
VVETLLAGRVAIVTGAGRGIGRGIARVFATKGAKVILADLDRDLGEKSVEEINKAGGESVFVRSDVTKQADAEALARTAVQMYGKLDILCNNAGVYPNVALADMTEAQWNRVLEVNLTGTFLAVKACLPQMIEQRSGRIVLTSSVTGPRTGVPGLVHYAASKSGINGFIRCAAVELAKYGITVNGVEPGNIYSEGLHAQLGEDYIAACKKAVPLGFLGEPEDVGFAMAFLASDEARFITGQTIVVDGGQILPEN